ncbi:MAG TPA: hypothetical protein VMT83_03695, partial [Burkholderiaceae bacterium]|nr:hypothetical protein [Burkholderiaceae bacterium]
MNLKLTPGRFLAAAIVALSFWMTYGLIQAILAAGVTAIASWPAFRAFRARLPRGVGKHGAAAIFTVIIATFLIGPMALAGWALLGETHSLLNGLLAADGKSLALPSRLAASPVDSWFAAHRQPLAEPGAVQRLALHTDPGALLGWAQTLGQFTLRHALIVAFTILLLGFFYQEGTTLARELIGALRQAIGERAEHYVEVGTRAIRASVNSMLVVGLFDTVAMALGYSLVDTPRAWAWA